MWRIVNTDNFGGDYPDERFVGEEFADEAKAREAAELLNNPEDIYATRYHKVVELPYELRPGFEP